MHRLHEKGIKVNRTERRIQKPSTPTGLFATLHAFPRRQGNGTPSAGPRRRRLALALIPVVLLLFCAAAGPADGETESGPPTLGSFGFVVNEVHATRAEFNSDLAPNGSETPWRIEYATSEGGPWTLGASGTKYPPNKGGSGSNALVQHLTPKAIYFARLLAKNASGSFKSGTIKFTTATVSAPEILRKCSLYGLDGEATICSNHLPSPTSVDFHSTIETNGADTHYRYEYATSEAGPYTPVPGASGAITVAEDVATPEAHLEGLTPETHYYIRVVAENEKGAITAKGGTFVTHTDRPETDFSIVFSKITATSAGLKGRVRPDGFETHWRFEYATAEAGPWTPGPEGTIAQAEAGYTEEGKTVEADLAGLKASTTYYVRLFGENANGAETSRAEGFETAGPPVVSTFAVHAIHGEAMRALGSVRPDGLDTHYHFQYVAQGKFPQTGWAEAQSTAGVDAGAGEPGQAGFPTTIVGQDLPGLQPGETYRYRIVATNSSPGDPVVYGVEQTLTVPVAASAEKSAACPNERLRSGLSGHLPDCRAYEQVTPVDKGGAEDFLNYGLLLEAGALVGGDGDHVMLDAAHVSWGSSADSGQSPYFFSRTSGGWRMAAGTAQPEAGLYHYEAQVYSPELTQFGFEASWGAEIFGAESASVEFKAGPPGGPYTTVATVPRKQAGELNNRGWVAASEDFSKLILSIEDRSLVPGHTSATKNGYDDLYEYSDDQLRQVNVTGAAPGVTIGACGARMALGVESAGETSSAHAVSSDGSRVFFEAVPSGNCGEASHLYIRVNGSETVDIGAYSFVAANAQDSKLLLDKRSGNTYEYLLYETEPASAKLLFSTHEQLQEPVVSEEFTALYFASRERLTPEAPPLEAESATNFQPHDTYRYDISKQALHFVAQGSWTPSGKIGLSTSPDGRYLYLNPGQLAGVPGAAPSAAGYNSVQAYRFDSATGLIQCVSCASPFDPEPKLIASFAKPEGSLGVKTTRAGLPNLTTASANGDYVFFQTPAALLPQDVDGEVEPEGGDAHGGHPENKSLRYDNSVSSDVYEWRHEGVDGCAHIQGCLSLISPGTGGFLVTLLGTTNSGRDVFFDTGSQLLSSDNDTSLDMYDARVGGGFAESTRPVECEGDACSTPSSPPNDFTPSSFTFAGTGNVVQPTPAKTTAKSKQTKPKKKAKGRKKAKKRKASKQRGKAKKSSRRSK
jgi:hypothetical protein